MKEFKILKINDLNNDDWVNILKIFFPAESSSVSLKFYRDKNTNQFEYIDNVLSLECNTIIEEKQYDLFVTEVIKTEIEIVLTFKDTPPEFVNKDVYDHASYHRIRLVNDLAEYEFIGDFYCSDLDASFNEQDEYINTLTLEVQHG